jgi:prefoldin alpha subunit
MNQELLVQAGLLEEQAREIAQRIENIEREISDLSNLFETLRHLIKSKENRMIATLGKGVMVPVDLVDKNLFVDVGFGVIVKKSPDEVREIVNSQLKRLADARTTLMARFEIVTGTLQDYFKQIEESQTN